MGEGEWREIPITVEVERLLPLLADSLYPRPDIAIRELLANASDAATKKRDLIEGGEPVVDSTEPCIDIRYDDMGNQLIVRDTGAGMTQADVETHLTKIGVSGTRIYEEQIHNHEMLKELIGQFGIGLLACFKLGEDVTIVTRSVLDADPASGTEWRAEKGEPKARVRPARVDTPGTTVTVKITSRENRQMLRERLHALVRFYGDLLPVPIRDAASHDPLNSYERVPWRDGDPDDEGALAEYLVRRAAPAVINPPLWVMPIQPGAVDMQGVVYIPNNPDFVNMRGSVDLYVRHMLVRCDCDGILPEGCIFCHAVVDCADLTMIMSREDVMRDGQFQRSADELGRQICAGLRMLATGRPRDFHVVQRTFDMELKYGATRNPKLFAAYADELRFFVSSDARTKTLREYCESARQREDEQWRNSILYVSVNVSPQERFQIDRVLQERQLEAVELRPSRGSTGLRHEPDSGDVIAPEAEGLDKRFLEMYAQERGMELVPADRVVDAFPASEDEKWRKVEDLFRSVLGARVREVKVSAFQPADLPILLRVPSQAATRHNLEQIRQATEKVRASSELPREVLEVLERASKMMIDESGALELLVNANNSLIQLLEQVLATDAYRAWDHDEYIVGTVAADLYNLALQYGGFALSSEGITTVVTTRRRLLESLLNALMILAQQNVNRDSVLPH